MGIFGWVFLLLLALKLAGVITISWWLVCLPLLIVLGFFVVTVGIPFIIIWRNK